MKKSPEKKPPVLIYFFLKLLIRNDMRLYILGDFDEGYSEVAENSGKRQADFWYLKQFFRSIPKIFFDTVKWRIEMIKIYSIIALRGMKKQRAFSLVSILGMSIALIVCIWIFLFIKDEFSYDRFHDNDDSIYSVIKSDHYFNHRRRYIEVNTGLQLKKYFSGIKYAVRFTPYNVIVRHEDKLFQEKCWFADKDFFQMFSFELKQGQSDNILEIENAVILTESLAKKYFGCENPVGNTLNISFGELNTDYTVSGIAEDVPSNSTLQFQMLMNIKELNRIFGPDILTNKKWALVYTFIQLEEDVVPETIEAGLPDFFTANFKPVIEERKSIGSWNQDGPTITLGLQSLKDIHFHSQGIEVFGEGDIKKSYLFGGIGFLILLIAWINFTNLSVCQASTRFVEIGVRKVLGAGRKNLIYQFRNESILIVLISMTFAITAGLLLLPFFNNLCGKNILESEFLSLSNLTLFGGVSILIGLITGLYPGAVLSRIQPAKIFQGFIRIGGKNNLTRLLILIQLSVSIFLIISTLVLSKQLKFIHTKDLGYQRKGILVINTFETRKYEINERIFNFFEAETEGLSYIKSLSGCVFPLSEEIGDAKLPYKGKRLPVNFASVHYNFFETMDIKFIDGRDFPRLYPQDIEPVIVTESLINAYDIENPIGTRLNPGTEIIGVVEDIHFWNLKEKIKPTIIRLDRRVGPRKLLVRIDPEDSEQAIASLKEIWKKVQPNKPFDYTFEDSIFRSKYAEEKRWNEIIFYSSLLAILISCMGLIGITLLTIGRKIKEIGIRKVLGASIWRIYSFLIRESMVLVGISNLIAWPTGYYFMNQWLKSYAYRTDIDIGIFFLAGFLTLFLSLGTIGFQVFKAASVNPSELLRDE